MVERVVDLAMTDVCDDASSEYCENSLGIMFGQ